MLTQKADSAVVLDIPKMSDNMADNNNKNNMYVWSNEETIVFLEFIQELNGNFRWKTATKCNCNMLFLVCNL